MPSASAAALPRDRRIGFAISSSARIFAARWILMLSPSARTIRFGFCFAFSWMTYMNERERESIPPRRRLYSSMSLIGRRATPSLAAASATAGET